MGLFDVVEIRQHVRSIGEYVFYFVKLICRGYGFDIRFIPFYFECFFVAEPIV